MAAPSATPGRGTLPGATGLSERRSGVGLGGTSPAPLPPQGLARHAPPGPILYALWVSKMSVARMTAPALASSRTRPGRPFATAFSPISAGVFGRFLVAHALRFEASYSRPGLGPPAARFGASTGLGGNRPRLPPPYSARGGERCAFPLAGAGSAGVLGAGTPGDLRGGWPGMGSAWPRVATRVRAGARGGPDARGGFPRCSPS
jgi:hypothetical protein